MWARVCVHASPVSFAWRAVFSRGAVGWLFLRLFSSVLWHFSVAGFSSDQPRINRRESKQNTKVNSLLCQPSHLRTHPGTSLHLSHFSQACFMFNTGFLVVLSRNVGKNASASFCPEPEGLVFLLITPVICAFWIIFLDQRHQRDVYFGTFFEEPNFIFVHFHKWFFFCNF